MHFYSECGMQSLGAATSKLAFKKVCGLGDCLVVSWENTVPWWLYGRLSGPLVESPAAGSQRLFDP